MARREANHLLIPVETFNREFDGKLLLALMAAERGWKPILGGRTAMHRHLASFPRSIYVSKGVRSGSRLIFELLEKLGHAIVAFDEEALVRFSDEIFLMKLEAETFSRVRLLFAWGHDNAQIWRRSPHYAGQPIVEAGNPRVDMMRPELRGYFHPQIDDIGRRFGKFVLINSNFAVVNHFIANHTRFKVSSNVPQEQVDPYREGFNAHKRALFDAFRALLPGLSAALPSHNIVVRPHPSENAEPWHAAAAGLKNVHVLHEGSVVPWLAAASALVHNGCTSAVEAAVVGTPAFAYRPLTSQQFDLPMPNALSRQHFKSDSLFGELRATLDGGAVAERLDQQQQTMLRDMIASLDGALSCQRILDGIEAHRALLGPSPHANRQSWWQAWLRLQRRAAGRALRTQLKGHRSSKTYTAHKFPGISQAQIDEGIARFAVVLGRFAGFRARPLQRDIFIIEAA